MVAQDLGLGLQVLTQDSEVGDLAAKGTDGLHGSADIIRGHLHSHLKICDTRLAVHIPLCLELIISLLL